MQNTNLTYAQIAGEAAVPPDRIGSSDATDTTRPANQGGAVVAEVNRKYTAWRSDRRPLETTWAVNAALIRGLANTKWNPVLNILESGSKTPAHRSRDNINLILPKVRGKLSKFLKSRAIPVVMAASTDHEDILNAKATTKVLEYLWDKLQLEELYEEALLWSMQTGKAFWWFRWNPGAVAQVKTPPNIFGKTEVLDIPDMGDPEVELGTAFELLVADMGITRVQRQPEIMRVKLRLTADVEAQYGLPSGSIVAEVKESDLFQYQKQIAQLGARAAVGIVNAREGSADEKPLYCVVKELFTAPSGRFPKGRYVCVAGDQLLHESDELPYGLHNTNSPYPVVEFADMITAGQFWPTTMVEQLAAGQNQYRRLRNQLDEQLKLQSHPWIFIPKQAAVHQNAFGSESGQKIPFNFQPGMPHPRDWVVRPEPIVQDVYKTMQMIREEMDHITNLYPAAIGAQGATSGFDTNLLQEAADSVFAPDIRRNELALRDAAYKLRRLAKLGYDIPRLISIVGRDSAPDVFEFSQEQIDEHANIVIDTGSALPNLKGARIDAIMKMDERQLFGPPGDSRRNRTLARMLDLGSPQENVDLLGQDEDQARLENLAFTRSEPVEDPMPWEDHDVHYDIHTNLLKSAEIKSWKPEQRAALVRHVILHVKFKNPVSALQLAGMFGMQDVVAEIQQTMLIQQQAAVQAAMVQQPPQTTGAPPEQGPPPPQGGPAPQAPPQA